MKQVATFFLSIFSAHVLMAQNVGINTTNPDRPLTIRALGDNQELLSLRNNADQTLWHVNIMNNGLNFSQTGVRDHVLYLHMLNRVGINTQNPTTSLHVMGDGIESHVISLQNPFLADQRSNLLSIAFRDVDYNTETPNSKYSYLGMGKTNEGGFFVIALPGSSLGAPAERFRITGSGRVGIGTPNPQKPLHVYRTGGNPDIAMFETDNVIGNLSVKSESAELLVGTDDLGGVVKTANSESFRIATGDDTRIYIYGQDGNVAIGSSIPQEKLHVLGKARFDDGIRFTSEQGGGLLNYYREHSFLTSLVNGNSTIGANVPIRVVRVGSMVTVMLQKNLLQLNINSPIPELQLTTSLPSGLRPLVDEVRVPIQVLNNGVAGIGLMIIQTNGVIRFRPNASNMSTLWSGNENAAIYTCSIQYAL